MPETPPAQERYVKLAEVLSDLDRCHHGRHEEDACFDCPDGVSAGNPLLVTGQTIGHSLYGHPIVVPRRNQRHLPEAWRP